MTSALKQSAVAAVIGGALAFAPARAPGLPLTTDTMAETQKKSVEEQLDEINRKLNRLTELLDGRRDEKGFPLPSDPGLVAELRTLKDRVAALETQLKQLQNSTSLRPGTTTDLMAGKGTVRVVNEYPVEISIVVNQNSYRVAPNTRLDVTVPAGEFTYQLLQSGAAVTRSTIREKETVTLRIR
jgi:seryl-tRNA synthetase